MQHNDSECTGTTVSAQSNAVTSSHSMSFSYAVLLPTLKGGEESGGRQEAEEEVMSECMRRFQQVLEECRAMSRYLYHRA